MTCNLKASCNTIGHCSGISKTEAGTSEMKISLFLPFLRLTILEPMHTNDLESSLFLHYEYRFLPAYRDRELP